MPAYEKPPARLVDVYYADAVYRIRPNQHRMITIYFLILIQLPDLKYDPDRGKSDG